MNTLKKDAEEFVKAWNNFLEVIGKELRIYDLLDWIIKWIPNK